MEGNPVYLSVIIPVRNEEAFIRQTLESLIHQDYPPERFELLVVDGMSTDGTRSVVERFIADHTAYNIRLLENRGVLSSGARNIGVRASRGKLIAVIDGHVYIPGRKLFAKMEEIRETRNALCLARPAPLDVPGLESGTAYWIAVARKSWLGHSRNSYIYSEHEGFIDPMSSGFAYDRSVFDRVGYFDESFDAAEDVEYHYRLKEAGIEAYTSPALLVYSYPRTTMIGLLRQQIRYGEGRARLIHKHPGAFSKETAIPTLLFLFFLVSTSLIFWPFTPSWLRTACLIGIAAYWVLVLAAALDQALRLRRLLLTVPVAVAIWATHIGLGWGFLGTIIRERPGVRVEVC